MKKSKVPAPLISNSGATSTSLLAHIINSEYTLALPLYRREQEMAREDKKKCYVWVYHTSGDALYPIVLYDYQPSRAGECASSFLKGFSGLLHTDGYDVYHCKLLPEITVAGCWAHMRRKFADTLKTLPKDIRERQPASKGLDFCNRLFMLEEEYTEKKLSFEQRYQARLERSKPIAEAFFSWARTEQNNNPAPQTIYGAALGYAVNQEGWLMKLNILGLKACALRPFLVMPEQIRHFSNTESSQL